MNQRNYKEGIPYLKKACDSGYEPAIIEMIYINLYYNNVDCAENIYPLFKKLNMNDKNNSLLYDIEKISRPELKELDEDQDSS